MLQHQIRHLLTSVLYLDLGIQLQNGEDSGVCSSQGSTLGVELESRELFRKQWQDCQSLSRF